MKHVLAMLTVLVLFGVSAAAKETNEKHKVLVVFSSSEVITLKNGHQHATGFFLQEFVVPARLLKAAGYELVYANPKGTNPVVDEVSNRFWLDEAKTIKAPWFKDKKALDSMLTFCESEGICASDSSTGTRQLEKLSDLLEELDTFAGVFFPGGHAPMEDLWKDPVVGKVLTHFHANQKPTALICHAPIALLAAMKQPEAYIAALTSSDPKVRQTASKLSEDWLYRDYKMTSFSTKEERQEEPGEDNVLGGHVRFYPDEALDGAMADGAVAVRATKWRSHVIRHAELITGQNPFSDEAFGRTFLKALKDKAKAQKTEVESLVPRHPDRGDDFHQREDL